MERIAACSKCLGVFNWHDQIKVGDFKPSPKSMNQSVVKVETDVTHGFINQRQNLWNILFWTWKKINNDKHSWTYVEIMYIHRLREVVNTKPQGETITLPTAAGIRHELNPPTHHTPLFGLWWHGIPEGRFLSTPAVEECPMCTKKLWYEQNVRWKEYVQHM